MSRHEICPCEAGLVYVVSIENMLYEGARVARLRDDRANKYIDIREKERGERSANVDTGRVP